VTPLWGHLIGVLIVLMMMLFVGIWIWVWLPRHQRSFGWLARLPMEDAGTQRHGPLPPIAGEQRR